MKDINKVIELATIVEGKLEELSKIIENSGEVDGNGETIIVEKDICRINRCLLETTSFIKGYRTGLSKGNIDEVNNK